MEFVSSLLGVRGTDWSGLFTQEIIIAKESDCHLGYCHLRKKNYSTMTIFFISVQVFCQGQSHLHNISGIKSHDFNTENNGDPARWIPCTKDVSRLITPPSSCSALSSTSQAFLMLLPSAISIFHPPTAFAFFASSLSLISSVQLSGSRAYTK